ncbi:MAG: hypothetical protein R3279_01160 [Putridiphycobacter sp.]|nr:hypothetical protein [Putridiphycobacter sp.]
MKSVFAMAGTFTLTIFVPLFSGAKSRNSRDSSADLLIFFLEHPGITFGLCVGVTLIYNIYTFSSNKKRNYVVGMRHTDGQIIFGLTNIYYKQTHEISVPVVNLEYKVITKTSDIDGETTTIHFVEKDTQNIVGVIKPGHVIWSKHKKAIMEALYQLHLLGVKSTRVKKGGTSSVEALFK